MLAGGGCVAGGRTPAKPTLSEVVIIWGCSPPVGSMVHRRKSQLRWSEPSSEDSHASARSTPESECWPEEGALRVAELLRSRGGRRWSSFGIFSSGGKYGSS